MPAPTGYDRSPTCFASGCLARSVGVARSAGAARNACAAHGAERAARGDRWTLIPAWSETTRQHEERAA